MVVGFECRGRGGSKSYFCTQILVCWEWIGKIGNIFIWVMEEEGGRRAC